MKTKLKLVRFVIAVTFGSLLWAGCASPDDNYDVSLIDNDPPDLLKWRADTHPELRNGLYDRDDSHFEVYDLPYGVELEDAAGTDRFPKPVHPPKTNPK